MREERLLERIRSWEKEPGRRAKEDPGRVNDSILEHLRRILNTRQGNVPIADDYGIPDFLDLLHSFPGSVREIERALRQAIQKFEPRLMAARVSFIPNEEDPLSLRFRIAARISSDARKQVVYETLIDSDGKIHLKD
jgi:type VI secretion system protein